MTASLRLCVLPLALVVLALAGCGNDPESAETDPAAESPGWSYAGEAGPDRWASIDAENELCDSGLRQSPIDITGARPGAFPKIRTSYHPERVEVENNGHAIEVTPVDPRSSIRLAGVRYELAQFHIHSPSEELVQGRPYDATVHMVHVSDEGKLAVVALLVETGPDSPALRFPIPTRPGDVAELDRTLDPGDLLPDDDTAFRYQGSLTTPPCTEGVTWTVFRQPITMSRKQLGELRRAHRGNARPVQPLNGRRIVSGPALAE